MRTVIAVVVLTLVSAVGSAYAADVEVDLGNITVKDTGTVIDDMKAMVDKYIPTPYQKTAQQYKDALIELCRKWIIAKVKREVNEISVDQIRDTADVEEEQAENRQVTEESE